MFWEGNDTYELNFLPYGEVVVKQVSKQKSPFGLRCRGHGATETNSFTCLCARARSRSLSLSLFLLLLIFDLLMILKYFRL